MPAPSSLPPETTALPASRSQQLIVSLQLKPHPEGGWYREVFRSSAQVQPADARPPRQALTSIYFLLEAGQHSRWHRVLSDEAWVHLEGSALDLWQWDSAGLIRCTKLGPVSANPLLEAQPTQPQHVIEAGFWQAARPVSHEADAFTLVACMVGPGFDFADFEMMRTDGIEARLLARDHPAMIGFI